MLKNLPIVHILWYVKVGIWLISADSPAFFRMAESAALLLTYFNLRPTYLPTYLQAFMLRNVPPSLWHVPYSN
jgi:hypothetical protein